MCDEAEVNNLYLGNYYVKEITPSEGYLLDEEEHDVVCDYEGDLVAEVSRSTTSAEQVIKQPFQLIKRFYHRVSRKLYSPLRWNR